MSKVRPLYLPLTYQDAADHGRLILRDGSSASIRLSTPADRDAVVAFYRRLSPASRRMRFFSESKPGEDLILGMCDSSDPMRGMTLLVWRTLDGEPVIIATGSYIAQNPDTAEFAVAVDDVFHGKGLGGLILERLSALAVTHGFLHFNAYTHLTNKAMLDVFRHSGFEHREQFQDGMVEVTLSVLPDAASEQHAVQRDRLFTKASIRPFFHPASVAVIGASRDPDSVGHRLLITLLRQGFAGVVYPVNPQASNVSGIRAVPRPEDLPEPVDLALIAVPRDQVESVVDGCAKRGVRALVVVTSGYAETGDEGAALQQRLVEKVRGYGMRMLGPNCLGLINTDPEVRLNASMSAEVSRPGRVALSSQSGALGMALLNLARRRGLGLSHFISMGNKADVTGNDLLYYWEDDPATDVILLYLESFGNPRRFGRIAREVSRKKPIVCVKAGRHQSGAEEHAVEALFQQAGVIRVGSLEEMYDTAALLGHQPLPPGPRVAVVTNSRGAGVLCADACISSGLELADLPAGASPAGVIDLAAGATPENYRETLDTLLRGGTADAVILAHIPLRPEPPEPVLDALCDAVSAARADGMPPVPVILVMMTEALTGSVMEHRGLSIPCYAFPEKAVQTLAAAYRYRTWREAPHGMIPDYEDADLPAIRSLLRRPDASDDAGWLTPDAVRGVFRLAGIPWVARSGNPSLAVEIAIEQHPLFGPVITFSLAGYHRRVLHDVTYRMTPLSDIEAGAMIRGIRGYPLLDAGGGDAADIAALEDMLLRLSFLAEELPEIEELQAAPVHVYRGTGGCACGDARIRLSGKKTDET